MNGVRSSTLLLRRVCWGFRVLTKGGNDIVTLLHVQDKTPRVAGGGLKVAAGGAVSLKTWMRGKRVPRLTQVRIMEFLMHLWQDTAWGAIKPRPNPHTP